MDHVTSPTATVIWTIALACITVAHVGATTKPKNIVFIVAEDLGWNDVGFNNQDMITPNLDKLAKQGVILNNSYVQPICTRSRHSFMTGIYPFKAGLQRRALPPPIPYCSPLNMVFLPQKLKTLGYTIYMFGKWHLGFCNWNCTPTYRGFDTFYGFYNGQTDYYNKTAMNGFDFREGTNRTFQSGYTTDLYASRAEEIIQSHDPNTPMFMYAAFNALHIPIEVPKQYEDMYPNITTEGRRKYCGMEQSVES